MTAEQIAGSYATNELNADNLLRGKWIQVLGIVESVSKDISDIPQINFDGGVYPGPVAQMRLPVPAHLGDVQPGMTVSVRCRAAGRVLGIPYLRDCVAAPPP